MKILIVSPYFWPEQFLINEVAISLTEQGCDVTVLTGQPNYPDGKIFEGYAWYGCQSGQHPEANLQIERVPILPRGKGAARLFFNYLSFIISAASIGPWKLRKKSPDVIFVYGVSPILSALPALLLGKLKGAPVVIWVQDLWPESIAATGYIRQKWALALVARLVRFIYQKADLLLAQSEAFIDDIKRLAEKTHVLYHPNSILLNPDKNAPLEAPPAATLFASLKDKFIILFAGNLGRAQAIETIIETAEKLHGETEIHFMLVGEGRLGSWARAKIKQQGLNNVSLPGQFPKESMPAFFQSAAALLVTLKDEPIFAKTVPSKIQAYLAAGRPIIAALNGEGARVVKEAGAGVTTRAEDAASLSAACLALYRKSAKERNEMGQNGKAYFKAHYDHETLMQQLTSHFKDAMDKKEAGKIKREGE